MSTTKKHNNSFFYIIAGTLTILGISMYLQNKRKNRIHVINKELDDYTNNPCIGFDKIGQDFKSVGKDMKEAIKDYEKEAF